MKRIASSLVGLLTFVVVTHAQDGPFPPDQWPASASATKVVHFVSVGDVFQPLGDTWITGNMHILSGGDQTTEAIHIGGFDGLKVTGSYLNTADSDFTEWADDEEIDILVQVYGDAALFTAAGAPRDFGFLIGTLPELAAPSGGQIPVEAKNKKWNWVLFRIPNLIRPSDGSRLVGSIPANAQGGFQAGGVNGGTIRIEGVPNLIVRVMAFGEKGAFGEPEQVNKFAAAEECPAEPATNLAWINLANSQSEHMQVMNNGDQLTTIEDSVGPTGAKRRAVRPNGNYVNFAVTDNFLGLPCNDPRSVKICVEFYDDPALAGKEFGPDAFATDDKGGIGFVAADRRQKLLGSDKWVRRSWVVPAVSLFGVNVTPLTAGPRLFFLDGAPIFISRFDLAILRTGNHPLAGQDPLADCLEDPGVCEYPNYVEMDLGAGLLDGLAPGTSGGDQEMIQAEAGPTNDRRNAIRPARDDGSPGFAHQYLNLAITDEKLGPSSQPNAQLAICVTYYDDPNLTGARFRPEVYMTDNGGTLTFAFTTDAIAVTLEGTDRWREAYFELPNVKFNGVNQGPQAAARFFVSDKVFFTRVRYAVIRPCGPQAGINRLESCKPVSAPSLGVARAPDGKVRISWPVAAEGYNLQSAGTLLDPNAWQPVATAPTVEGDQNVVTVTADGTAYYRLQK
jgi:hypothetical protein